MEFNRDDLIFYHITEPIKVLIGLIINGTAPRYMLTAIIDETIKIIKDNEIQKLENEMLEYLNHFPQDRQIVRDLIQYFKKLQ